ncbi:MAG: serpin family protein [Tannerella sp.]|nr:serpin family protein [Tannerella sp.]
MKKHAFLAMTALLPCFISCNGNSDSDGDEPIEQLPDAQPIELRLAAKVETDNTFALDFFRTACDKADSPATNVFVSPLSVSMALNMTLNGARGTTADEMLAALRADGYSLDEINEYSKSLREALTEVDPSTLLSIANSIWYHNVFPVKQTFIDLNSSFYDAEVRKADFKDKKTVDAINAWCDTKTKGKITKIIDELSPDAVMLLMNAIYFKGIWKNKFDKGDTRKEDFTQYDGSKKAVDMMRQTSAFNYAADQHAAYLELPYGNNAFSMIIALPESSVDGVVENLGSEQWNDIAGRMYGHKVNLRLPRFKTECEFTLEQNVLPAIGMIVPFGNQADFSGISDVATYISRVIHKTFVEVNEEGTEAAAVTGVEMGVTSVGPDPQPVDFFVNRPFVFAIREKSTGVILFIGKIAEL